MTEFRSSEVLLVSCWDPWFLSCPCQGRDPGTRYLTEVQEVNVRLRQVCGSCRQLCGSKIWAPTDTPIPQSSKEKGGKQKSRSRQTPAARTALLHLPAARRFTPVPPGRRDAPRNAPLLPPERSSRAARNCSASDRAAQRFRRRWRHGGLGAAGPARGAAAGGGGAGGAAAGGDGGVRPQVARDRPRGRRGGRLRSTPHPQRGRSGPGVVEEPCGCGAEGRGQWAW